MEGDGWRGATAGGSEPQRRYRYRGLGEQRQQASADGGAASSEESIRRSVGAAIRRGGHAAGQGSFRAGWAAPLLGSRATGSIAREIGGRCGWTGSDRRKNVAVCTAPARSQPWIPASAPASDGRQADGHAGRRQTARHGTRPLTSRTARGTLPRLGRAQACPPGCPSSQRRTGTHARRGVRRKRKLGAKGAGLLLLLSLVRPGALRWWTAIRRAGVLRSSSSGWGRSRPRWAAGGGLTVERRSRRRCGAAARCVAAPRQRRGGRYSTYIGPGAIEMAGAAWFVRPLAAAAAHCALCVPRCM